MHRKIVVLSRRNLSKSPAMCCISEFENVLIGDFDAELCVLPDIPRDLAPGATIIHTALGFYQLGPLEIAFAALKQAGHRVIVYLFDGWDIIPMLSSPRRALRDRLRPSLRLSETVDQIAIPFRAVRDALPERYRSLVRHVPLAVDSTLVNGENAARPIDVIAYGRQPPEITAAVAEAMNAPAAPFIFHHTDHLSIEQINDMRLHRMHFWKLAQSSQVALAYDPAITSPHRVPMSIVGQRWFESLAAGCVVAGARPVSDEADGLLDWPDATIELPMDPGEAVGMLKELSRDTSRLAAIRARNVEEIRRRHDWRHRIPLMLD